LDQPFRDSRPQVAAADDGDLLVHKKVPFDNVLDK
jgi:hypothetical protein